LKEHEMATFEELVKEYRAAGFGEDDAREEAAREVRLTTGDRYFGRSPEEVAAMDSADAAEYALAARTAGVCDEFPAGEFAVAGFNCDLDRGDD
jgi:hypothetical protein